ncbi:MAG: hypothetical protein QM809_13465 [Gordonia sp. (in: high G+C Gram-positive bacteria)]|uniref:YncE family protein n=1 Tax=Gordonia sp. (in: high G+C Gram-positive bacteria) TaxID=84139 RepID=UPI0039E31B94
MRARSRIAAAVTALALTLPLAACGSDDGDGPGDVATVVPATPAASPPDSGRPAGTVVPALGPVGPASLVLVGGTAAVLGADGVVRLYGAPAGGAPAPREVSGRPKATALAADGDGFVAVSPTGFDLIARDGAVRTVAADLGRDPISVAVADDGRYLVGTASGHVLVFTRAGERERDIHSFVSVDRILVAPEKSAVAGQVTVVDRAQSSVTPIDVDSGEVKAALRAGNGVTNAVVDPAGRVIASNTRDDELLGFFGQPIVMRFRFPVAHSPYAVAYDVARGLAWVATTGDNQALAYDLASGEPRQQVRIPTVGQVSSIAVDPTDGTLYLFSARGDGLQVVAPADVDAAR